MYYGTCAGSVNLKCLLCFDCDQDGRQEPQIIMADEDEVNYGGPSIASGLLRESTREAALLLRTFASQVLLMRHLKNQISLSRGEKKDLG